MMVCVLCCTVSTSEWLKTLNVPQLGGVFILHICFPVVVSGLQRWLFRLVAVFPNGNGMIIIIMVIFKCYFSGEHIALSIKKTQQQRCEHRIRKNQQIKSTVHDAN